MTREAAAIGPRQVIARRSRQVGIARGSRQFASTVRRPDLLGLYNRARPMEDFDRDTPESQAMVAWPNGIGRLLPRRGKALNDCNLPTRTRRGRTRRNGARLVLRSRARRRVTAAGEQRTEYGVRSGNGGGPGRAPRSLSPTAGRATAVFLPYVVTGRSCGCIYRGIAVRPVFDLPLVSGLFELVAALNGTGRGRVARITQMWWPN